MPHEAAASNATYRASRLDPAEWLGRRVALRPSNQGHVPTTPDRSFAVDPLIPRPPTCSSSGLSAVSATLLLSGVARHQAKEESMIDEPWRPLSVRTSEIPTDWDVHHEGVPTHLWPSLENWIRTAVRRNNLSALSRIERSLQGRFSEDGVDPVMSLMVWCEDDDDLALDVVDFLLRDLQEEWMRADGFSQVRDNNTTLIVGLLDMLKESGSAWTVRTTGTIGLGRVVDTVTKEAFSEVVATGTNAAALLAKAWAAVFSRDPHYDDGYKHAVLAVESAAASRRRVCDRGVWEPQP